MGKTRKDLFEMWNETGKWPEVRDLKASDSKGNL